MVPVYNSGVVPYLLHEDLIDFLERFAGGVGVEPPDERDEGGVEHGEDDVDLPADVGDGGRGDFDDLRSGS